MVRRYLASLLLLATPALAAVELDGDSNGAIDVAKGGTNATTAAGARTALGVPATAATLVGDCTVGPCFDGSADGGNYLKFWAGTGSYWTALQGGAPDANRSWRLPIAAAPAAGETLVMTMDQYGQMGFLSAPETSGYVLSSTDAGVLSWAAGGSAGDDLGSAAYGDVVALWTTCTGYLKSDGTCDTPSGSATYPSAAGVANWDGSAWGTSYTVGTGASNLVQLNASAQLPAVSGALLTNIPMPAWFPASAPTADNMIIQATGGCSDAQYTDQSTCEINSGTWTPPVGAWTSVIDGLINDAGTGTDDLLSASEINTRISSATAFYQIADGDLDTAAGASAAGNSKLFGTNAIGVVGWYDIPVDTDTDDQAASEVSFTPNGSIAATDVQAAVQEVRDEAEPALGNPATTGYVLSSTTAGIRSWVAQSSGTDEFVYLSDCSTIVNGACVDTDTGGLYYYDGSAVVAVPLGSAQPVSMQQVFSSSTTLVAGSGSKTKAITGVSWTTADIGCDASDTLGVSVKTSSTVNGTYTEVGNVSLTAAAQNTAVDISSWADISAGTWVRIDLTGAPAAATECTVVIEGVEQ